MYLYKYLLVNSSLITTLYLGHGNAGMKLPETVFVGASSVKILDLGASFTKIHAELFSPLTNLEYLFLQFNEVGRLSSRNGITMNF